MIPHTVGRYKSKAVKVCVRLLYIALDVWGAGGMGRGERGHGIIAAVRFRGRNADARPHH